MLVQCTKGLLGKMGISPGELKSPEGYEQLPHALMAWHANLVSMDRRKAIVLMNNATRYPVVIYRPKPKDFARMKDLVREAIVVALRMEGVCETVIDRYMADAGEIEFSETANRSMVARLNHAANEVGFMQDYLDESTLIQRYISTSAGRLRQSLPGNEYFAPSALMLKHLGNYCDKGENGICQSVLDIELYQLKIQIEIEGFDIWRRVLAPSVFSFRHLHNVIQTVFDWQNYHLHMFEAKRTDSKTKQIMMDDDPEALECLDLDSCDVLQERFTALKDIFPDHEEVTYEYDFGDSWKHTITLEKTARSNALRATYLDGRGERPPEDVGGPWSYVEFMRIMADNTDPEHEDTKMWAKGQSERKHSPEEINRRLRHSMSTGECSPSWQ
ncbi:MAG: plasmid pRiA4b ORF-3 family protein [Clostridia bacterium]|nr:plasmid pRiA4b ORF-3 family protein [Clostridia bacterium]